MRHWHLSYQKSNLLKKRKKKKILMCVHRDQKGRVLC
jgi:hypothetical protein